MKLRNLASAASARNLVCIFAAVFLATTNNAWAVLIGNSQGSVDFPQGAISFADVLVDYSPVINVGGPSLPHRDPSAALGLPDYAGDNNCTGDPSCTFVSLGDGGSITLQFTNNALTGSGNADPDLHIFEVGPDVEDTFVEISVNGIVWFPVGSVGGSLSSIDIDAFGFGIADQFFYVRLTDDPNEGGQAGITVGADIDAVGAISTVFVAVPEPATLALLGIALVGLGFSRRKRSEFRPHRADLRHRRDHRAAASLGRLHRRGLLDVFVRCVLRHWQLH